jgi:uncharacterized delta-60 repeat protein
VLSSSGSIYDIFIARYNPDGTLHWAKRAGGTSSDFGYAVSVLSDDSIAVTGYFWNSTTIGLGEGNETVFSSAGKYDIFIARYNPDGTLHWARRAGGAHYDYCYAISVLSDDSIVVTGYFENSTTFGPGESNETVLSSAGDYDIFVARYNPDGTLHWAKRAGGMHRSESYAISVFSDNSIAVGGTFNGSVTFGPGEGNETVLSSAGDYDIFVARYNPDGTLHWAKREGGTDFDSGRMISVFSDNSIAVGGCFSGTVTFSPGESNETVLSSVGYNDILIARYNPDGTLNWAKRAGGIMSDYSLAISALSEDSIVVIGCFWGKATFGLGEVNETVLSNTGYSDIFIARYRK